MYNLYIAMCQILLYKESEWIDSHCTVRYQYNSKYLNGKCTISKNYAKVDLNTLKNKNVKDFLDHSSNISFFPLGVGHGVQREGKECEELIRTA